MIHASHSRLFFFVFALLSLTMCDNSLEDDNRYAEAKSIESYLSGKGLKYTKSNGVYHVAVVPSYGYEVNTGDTVEFWFKGYTPESTPLVFETNIKAEAITAKLDTNIRTFKPLRVIAGKTGLISGLNRGLQFCRLNQQSTIVFTSDLGFKDQIIGPVEAWSSLAYDIQVIYLNGKGIQAESKKLAEMNLVDYTLHSSGMYYKSVKASASTSYPKETDVVYGWYQCTLPDGTVIDEVIETNAKIDLSENGITTALRLAFTLVTVGSTSEFVAPSPLCYGKIGTKLVAPYQPLLYTVRLDSIKSTK